MSDFPQAHGPDSQNFHATCVQIEKSGVLLMGASGVGKSDLALRLIHDRQCRLVSDDQVILQADNNAITAHAPKALRGLLEVRGVGICTFDSVQSARINLIVKLDKDQKIERLPDFLHQQENILGVDIPFISLNGFEPSACLKIYQALNMLAQ